jgi:hypothetical protein
MSLSPESRLGLGLMTGALVYGIYQIQLPSATDVRSVQPGSAEVQSAERGATWMSVIAVSGIALLSKSLEVFCIGGTIVTGLAWTYRHADQVDPITKRATGYLTPDALAQAQMPAAPDSVGDATTAAAAPLYAPVI